VSAGRQDVGEIVANDRWRDARQLSIAIGGPSAQASGGIALATSDAMRFHGVSRRSNAMVTTYLIVVSPGGGVATTSSSTTWP
jgi:hypothetical protein